MVGTLANLCAYDVVFLPEGGQRGGWIRQSTCGAVCVNIDADSLWSLGMFECLIGMGDATKEQAWK